MIKDIDISSIYYFFVKVKGFALFLQDLGNLSPEAKGCLGQIKMRLEEMEKRRRFSGRRIGFFIMFILPQTRI